MPSIPAFFIVRSGPIAAPLIRWMSLPVPPPPWRTIRSGCCPLLGLWARWTKYSELSEIVRSAIDSGRVTTFAKDGFSCPERVVSSKRKKKVQMALIVNRPIRTNELTPVNDTFGEPPLNA